MMDPFSPITTAIWKGSDGKRRFSAGRTSLDRSVHRQASDHEGGG